MPVPGFCSYEFQILVKVGATGRAFFKVPLRINSFCCSNFNDFFVFNVPFQGTTGKTKTFMGRGKNLVEGKSPT